MSAAAHQPGDAAVLAAAGGSLLGDEVAGVFAADGVLALTQDGFAPRSGQTAMAGRVARVVENGGVLVVEAGTGVGKTFAYLVPALLSGERVLLSTATKTLQDQLFNRDLPGLLKVLNLPRRTALLKGRANYLCLHRLALARQSPATPGPNMVRPLAQVEEWAKYTTSGDLAELTGLDDRSPVIALVTSTRENCLGTPCPQWNVCHVNRARRQAMAADIVVINHHLFFADMAVRESGVAELLPAARVVVFDEAHQLNATGVQFLGVRLGSGQLLDFARDMLVCGLQHAAGLADWQTLAGDCERAARELRLVLGREWTGARLRWTATVPDVVDPVQWEQALRQVQQTCQAAEQALGQVEDMSPDFTRLLQRAAEFSERLQCFAAARAPDAVRWVDVGSAQIRLVESPQDIAPTMRALVAGSADAPASPQDERRRAWIFTSATLGDDAGLDWFTTPCGLEQAQALRVQSPFDYPKQAAVYVPRHLPRPADAEHTQKLAQWATPAIAALGGRTLFLTTTLRALRVAGEVLGEHLQGSGVEVLVQGQWPRRRLMERLRQGTEGGAAGCVLVASASFREGVDIPGDALQLVVMDKLPFPPPGDPLVEARLQRLEAVGRNGFREFSLPEAAVALRQGAGRLIRRETDSGLLVIGDVRLLEMSYGRRLLAALPPMRRLDSEEDWQAALQGLCGQVPGACS